MESVRSSKDMRDLVRHRRGDYFGERSYATPMVRRPDSAGNFDLAAHGFKRACERNPAEGGHFKGNSTSSGGSVPV